MRASTLTTGKEPRDARTRVNPCDVMSATMRELTEMDFYVIVACVVFANGTYLVYANHVLDVVNKYR